MDKELNVADYGAVGDGKTVCTEKIQRAVDLCPRGGRVIIPKGVFKSGAIYLKSDITLYLEEGATLLGSGNTDDYPVMGYSFEGYNRLCYASLINTDGAPCKNITIDGKGTIDANGEELFLREMEEAKGKRGRIICLRNTDNVTLRGVTFCQSPAWGVHLIYCNNVTIDNVTVRTKYDEKGNRYKYIFNGDGIDIDSCDGVIIKNSVIGSQDDCIAIKSGRDAVGRRVGIPSRNITVDNCAFTSGFGVAVGSEMSGGVEGVYVNNCTFTSTHSIASVKVCRGRGGYIRDIHYENCTLENNSTEMEDTKWFRGALYVDGFYGIEDFDADEKKEVDEGTPVVSDIYMKNITLKTVAGCAVYLCGLPEMPFKNIYLENVEARGKSSLTIKNIEGLHTKNVEVQATE